MNNIVVATIAFTSGVVAGFILSNFISVEKGDKPEKVYVKDIPVDKKEKEEEKPSSPSISPIHNKNKEAEYIEYSKLANSYNGGDQEEDEAEVNAQIQEDIKKSERREKNKNKIAPITKDDFDFEDDLDFEKKDLYYFVSDDVLTDEDGHHVDEETYIGKKPRQFGWMNSDEEKIYIRNNPQETDYQVWKEKCSSIDWWS